MKLIKKIAAIMFAFMLVVSMSCNVKAEEGSYKDGNGSITINNVIMHIQVRLIQFIVCLN